jgi:hypothetical protein
MAKFDNCILAKLNLWRSLIIVFWPNSTYIKKFDNCILAKLNLHQEVRQLYSGQTQLTSRSSIIMWSKVKFALNLDSEG